MAVAVIVTVVAVAELLDRWVTAPMVFAPAWPVSPTAQQQQHFQQQLCLLKRLVRPLLLLLLLLLQQRPLRPLLLRVWVPGRLPLRRTLL